MGKADNNAIKQIRFLRRIYTLDWHGGSTEYKNANDWLLFLVHTANGKKHCINNTKLREFIADEDWINGEVNTLSNIASNRTISLSWGSKIKDTKNLACEVSLCNDATLLSVGDLVVVSNHGTKRTHHAIIVSINERTSSAVVRWNSNSKKDLVALADCMRYDLQCVSERKCKPTDFYQNLPVKIQRSEASLTPPTGQMKNMYHSKDNLSKLCAEGAIRNLMHMLHHSTKDITMFWELATTSFPSLRSSLMKILFQDLL
jgi:hypothetical protein